MVDVAIIADDLTGALDAAAPFASRGRRVEAAVSAEALADIDCMADVITVNAATRSQPAEKAVSIVRDIAERVAALRPDVLFKKIDSTLRGHVADEASAIAATLQRHHAIVCPAVPDQGRIVRSGALVICADANGPGGDGNMRAISPLFDAAGFTGGVSVCDAADGDDLLHVAGLVLRRPSETIAIGAAGLAGALAEKLYGPARTQAVRLTAPGLFVVGSRAPATLGQLQELRSDPRVVVTMVDPNSPDGRMPQRRSVIDVLEPDRTSIPAGASESRVAESIAAVAAARFEALAPGTLFLCGGHIAERVLAALATKTVSIIAELEPGVPIASARIRGRSAHIVTKAGGFGDAGFLLRLADCLVPAT